MLTNEKIREILATEAKATPGPWWEQYEYDGGRTICQMRSTDTTVCVNRAVHVQGKPYNKTKENALLIALARNHIRELCEEVLRLRAALSSFAMMGNPRSYTKRPNQLEVPFEWYEAAYRALNDGK